MAAGAKMIAGLVASITLLASAPAAAVPQAAPPSLADQSSNAWLVLTDLSASQTADPTDPDKSRRRRNAVPPPLWSAGNTIADRTSSVMFVGLWWTVIALALAAGDNHDRANSPG